MDVEVVGTMMITVAAVVVIRGEEIVTVVAGEPGTIAGTMATGMIVEIMEVVEGAATVVTEAAEEVSRPLIVLSLCHFAPTLTIQFAAHCIDRLSLCHSAPTLTIQFAPGYGGNYDQGYGGGGRGDYDRSGGGGGGYDQGGYGGRGGY